MFPLAHDTLTYESPCFRIGSVNNLLAPSLQYILCQYSVEMQALFSVTQKSLYLAL